ncbi:hypothetical protein LXL04_038045 [Taraxacum kok-saghyz]
MQLNKKFRNITMGDFSATTYCTKIQILTELIANIDVETPTPDPHRLLNIGPEHNNGSLGLLLLGPKLLQPSTLMYAHQQQLHPVDRLLKTQVHPHGRGLVWIASHFISTNV